MFFNFWLIFKLLSETNQDHLQEQNFQRTKLIQAKLNLFLRHLIFFKPIYILVREAGNEILSQISFDIICVESLHMNCKC